MDQSSLVSCTMTEVSLDDPPAYVALSYAWGDANNKRPILVNGAVFQATENLEISLQHLRLREDARVIWIDAICINQNDYEEKSEQVQQMGQVYAKASLVISWLGPASINSEAAMKWMAHYGGLAHKLGIGSEPKLRLRIALKELDQGGGEGMNPELVEFLRTLSHEFDGWDPSDPLSAVTGLHQLFSRTYWTRTWTVQEVVLGKELQFMCGHLVVSEDHLHHSLRLVRNYAHYQLLLDAERATVQRLHDSTRTREAMSSIPTANPIIKLKLRRSRSARKCQFVTLIRHIYKFKATDPRDKVFSLLGMASDATKFGITPDYSKTYRDVYTHTTEMLIRHGYLEILSQLLDEVQQTGRVWDSDHMAHWFYDLEELSRPTLGHDKAAQLRAVWRTAVADQDMRQGETKARLTENIVNRLVDGVDASDIEPGDLVVLILGASVPFLFRKKTVGEKLRLIGEAYVHTIMDGEAVTGESQISTILVE
ncbi:hypothetical protein jhhlp_004822 [Lomentospora prolificans]|uniref:Heterokaryon incompatibility domain-containing protein n=1 Tax=Lomentospora prolificans TaxID=41688 RepID=A0A2N3N8J7_9PEZI|nr:hypothetical protein jhhlp_004822 [Lomentospora prolificans]